MSASVLVYHQGVRRFFDVNYLVAVYYMIEFVIKIEMFKSVFQYNISLRNIKLHYIHTDVICFVQTSVFSLA
jgi:hypothetical protein